MFIPTGNDTIWRASIFSDGLVQPPTTVGSAWCKLDLHPTTQDSSGKERIRGFPTHKMESSWWLLLGWGRSMGFQPFPTVQPWKRTGENKWRGNFSELRQQKDIIYIYIQVFPKMVVPNNHGFSYEKWSFWGVLGVPPFKETPICFPGNLTHQRLK